MGDLATPRDLPWRRLSHICCTSKYLTRNAKLHFLFLAPLTDDVCFFVETSCSPSPAQLESRTGCCTCFSSTRRKICCPVQTICDDQFLQHWSDMFRHPGCPWTFSVDERKWSIGSKNRLLIVDLRAGAPWTFPIDERRWMIGLKNRLLVGGWRAGVAWRCERVRSQLKRLNGVLVCISFRISYVCGNLGTQK